MKENNVKIIGFISYPTVKSSFLDSVLKQLLLRIRAFENQTEKYNLYGVMLYRRLLLRMLSQNGTFTPSSVITSAFNNDKAAGIVWHDESPDGRYGRVLEKITEDKNTRKKKGK